MRKVQSFKEYMDEQRARHGWPAQAPWIPSDGRPIDHGLKLGPFELAKAVFGRVPFPLRTCYHHDAKFEAVPVSTSHLNNWVGFCGGCGILVRAAALELLHANAPALSYMRALLQDQGPRWRQEIP